MNVIKRIIAAVPAVVLAGILCCLPAAAATYVSDDMNNKSDTAAAGFPQYKSYVAGVYGKDDKDYALKYGGAAVDQWFGHVGAGTLISGIQPGNIIEHSFDIAVSELGGGEASYFVQVRVNGSILLGNNYGIQITQNGSVLFFGVDTGVHIMPEQWYNFKYVLTADEDGNSTSMTAYIDNTALGNAEFDFTLDSIDFVRYHNDSRDQAKYLYIDNIVMRTVEPYEITVDGFDTGEVQEMTAEALGKKEISVMTAENCTPVDRLKVYINGKLSQTLYTEPYIADFSSKDLGLKEILVKAVDSDGTLLAEYEKKIAVIERTSVSIINNDFSSGLNGVETIGAEAKGGYARLGRYDSEHGDSLLLGTASESDTNDLGPRVGVTLTEARAVYDMEYDICIPKENIEFYQYWRNDSNSINIGVIHFGKDESLTLLGSGGTVSDSALQSYERGKWYHIRTVIDASTRRYDLYIDGELQVAGRLANNGANTTGVSEIRFVIYNYACDDGKVENNYIAIDNLCVTIPVSSPYVVKAVSGLNDSGVLPAASEIYLLLNSAINGENIENSVTLECDNGSIPVDAVRYDAENIAVVITPGADIASSVSYTGVLKKGIALANGALNSDVSFHFTALPDEVDVVESDFDVIDGNVYFTGETVNGSGLTKTVKLIMSIYSPDGILSSVYAEDIVIPVDGGSIKSSGYPVSSGDAVCVHLSEYYVIHSPVTETNYFYTVN